MFLGCSTIPVVYILHQNSICISNSTSLVVPVHIQISISVYLASRCVHTSADTGVTCLSRLPVTSPQKLRNMVTSPHFEKVRGDVGIVGKCVGMWGEEGEMLEEV